MNPLADLELQLQTDARSLRALAKDLVGDRHLADDMVQEAVSRTLQSPPTLPGGLGGWLQTVVRRLCLQHRRHTLRRSARERLAARPEQLEPTIDIAARREALRAVTAAVFALEEPYQTTLLLRYFENLSPTAIAAATHTSVATVKSRLQRGLLLLQKRMDAGRPKWRPALLAACGVPLPIAAATLATTGALLMGSGTKLALAAAVAAACAVVVLNWGGEIGPAAPVPAPERTADQVAAAARADGERAADAQRTSVPVTEPEPPQLAHPFAFDLEIEVRDRDGLPVEGAQVHLAPVGCSLARVPEPTAQNGIVHAQWSGKQAAMEMAVMVEGQQLRRLLVQAGAPRRLVLEGVRPQTGAYRLWARALEGKHRARVVDQLDVGAANQELALAEFRLGSVLDVRTTTSDLTMQTGLHPFAVFGDRLVRARRDEQAWAVATRVNFLTELSLSFEATRAVVVSDELIAYETKDSSPTAPAVLEGVVYDEQGKPVPDATVGWGHAPDLPASTVRSDKEGRFRFDNLAPGWIELRAGGGDAGLQHSRALAAAGQTITWQAHLRRESTIRGRAIGSDGKPLAGFTVEAVGAQDPSFDACKVRDDGSFELPNQPGGAAVLLLHHGQGGIKLPVAVLGAVLPDTGEHLFRLDAAATQGRLQIEPIAPPGVEGVQAEVRVWQEETGRGASMDKVDDEPCFRLGGLPAGFYRVEVGASSIGWVDAGRHWVDGTHAVDLGRIELPRPGTVRISYADGTVPPADRFEQQICQRRPGCDLRVVDETECKQGELALPAGDYWLLWRDADGKRQLRGFSVQAGKATAVDTSLPEAAVPQAALLKPAPTQTTLPDGSPNDPAARR